MKYAVCVLAYNKPSLLGRLTERLKSDNTEIYIHLDARSDIRSFSGVRHGTFISDRVKVYWGGRSMVKAMLNLIKHVLEHSDADYLLFVSGEDFPVVLPDRYPEHIDASKNYLEYGRLPRPEWYQNGMNRIQYWYPFKMPKSPQSRILLKLQKWLGVRRNLESRGFGIYGGSQWININRDAAEYIVQHFDTYYRLLKYCYIPDEMLFQTILLNSGLKETVVNSNLRYLRHPEGISHAIYVDCCDMQEIIATGALFCRKVRDEATFDRLLETLSTAGERL